MINPGCMCVVVRGSKLMNGINSGCGGGGDPEEYH